LNFLSWLGTVIKSRCFLHYLTNIWSRFCFINLRLSGHGRFFASLFAFRSTQARFYLFYFNYTRQWWLAFVTLNPTFRSLLRLVDFWSTQSASNSYCTKWYILKFKLFWIHRLLSCYLIWRRFLLEFLGLAKEGEVTRLNRFSFIILSILPYYLNSILLIITVFLIRASV